MEVGKPSVLVGGKFGINWQDSTTARGYSLAEVRSAVIKEIRRLRPDEAMFWTLEMLECGEQVARELWQDLRVFTLEDVGLASPDALVVVDHCQKLFDDLPKNDNRRLLAVAHAVYYLARSRKTRYANEALTVVLQSRADGARPDIPDYAVDLHTRRGRAVGRGMEHYLTTAACLDNEDTSFPRTYRQLILSGLVSRKIV
jgi:replication-associated recombination protein RarA